MAELLSSAQMRAIEARAIASGAVSGRTLMERAGRGATAEILAHWPELAARAHAAVVLCGPGNNGGDGFVIARRLRDRGWAVEVLFWGDPARQPADARANHDMWCEIGTVTPLTLEAAQTGRRPALVVDALFGTGLSRAIPLDCAKAVTAIKARDEGPEDRSAMPCYVVAVDCPSGLDCDSGAVLLPEIPAETRASDAAEAIAHWQQAETAQRAFAVDLTVTFHRAKLGHYLDRGCHPLRIVDIGLVADAGAPAHPASPRAADSVRLLARAGPGGPNPWPAAALSKREDAHKYAHGHALVLAGGPGRSGAARLAARAALRVGAGAVTLGAPGAAMVENAAQLNAVMLETIDTAADLTAFLATRRINAVCAGPALGLGARATGLIAALLETGLPALLDADAITLIARDTALQQALH
ncbi:MAG: NAD(P)H-hydrate epimerase, partial [Pseudomonadota bacterium]